MPRSIPPHPHHTLDQLGSLVLSELEGLDVNIEEAEV